MDVITFANDWNGDPLSKKHIMRRLAKHGRVLWVNSIGNRVPRANASDMRRIFDKVAGAVRGVKEVDENIFALSPLAIPLYSGAVVKGVNKALLMGAIRVAAQRIGLEKPITWTFAPSSAPVVGHLGEDFVLYHCVDEFSAFSDAPGRAIAELEKELCAAADLVITSAEPLYEHKKTLARNVQIVRHGVDLEHFAQALSPALDIPIEVANLARPVIGFWGLIADWVDVAMIAALAKANPTFSYVLLGKISTDVSALTALPNVHLLGVKSYDALPAYARAFDLAILPFVENRLTANANPLKLREYLAAGLPVVATALPEVVRITAAASVPMGLREEARIAAWDKAILAALATGAGPSKERAAKMASEGWDARVAEMLAHVEQARSERGIRSAA